MKIRYSFRNSFCAEEARKVLRIAVGAWLSKGAVLRFPCMDVIVVEPKGEPSWEEELFGFFKHVNQEFNCRFVGWRAEVSD